MDGARPDSVSVPVTPNDSSSFRDRMGCGVTTAVFVVLGVYISMQHQQSVAGHSVPPSSDVASGPASNGNSNTRGRARSLVLGPRIAGSPQYIRARLAPIEPAAEILNDFVIDDEDLSDFSKRQSDDYGHMRFGKRGEQFDDYGHMRFGRSIE